MHIKAEFDRGELRYILARLRMLYTRVYIQGVPGGKDLTSGECSLGQTIPI
jgi:hypothetical protein